MTNITYFYSAVREDDSASTTSADDDQVSPEQQQQQPAYIVEEVAGASSVYSIIGKAFLGCTRPPTELDDDFSSSTVDQNINTCISSDSGNNFQGKAEAESLKKCLVRRTTTAPLWRKGPILHYCVRALMERSLYVMPAESATGRKKGGSWDSRTKTIIEKSPTELDDQNINTCISSDSGNNFQGKAEAESLKKCLVRRTTTAPLWRKGPILHYCVRALMERSLYVMPAESATGRKKGGSWDSRTKTIIEKSASQGSRNRLKFKGVSALSLDICLVS